MSRRALLAPAWLSLLATLAPGPRPALAEDAALPRVEGSAGPEHGKLNTSDASPVGARTLEVEASYGPSWNLRGRGGFDRSRRGYTHGLGLAATYGIVDDLDLSMEAGFATLYDSAYDHDGDESRPPEPAHGLGLTDTTVGGRWRFLDLKNAGLEVAYLSDLVLPTGARASASRPGLTQLFWSFENALVVSKDWGRLTANAELGFSLPFGPDRGDERGTLFANLAGGWQALPWLQPTLELNYERSYEASAAPDAQLLCVTGGIIAPFGDGYRLSLGAQYAAWGRHTGQFVNGILAFKAAF